MSASSSRRQQPKKGQAPQPQTDPWWLDEPIRRPWGRGLGKDFNPKLAWLIDRLPGRARALIMRAATGQIRFVAPAPDPCVLLPAVRTMREFLALPAGVLLMQHRYGYTSHIVLCRALRINGVTGTLFGVDEQSIRPAYPYLPEPTDEPQ